MVPIIQEATLMVSQRVNFTFYFLGVGIFEWKNSEVYEG